MREVARDLCIVLSKVPKKSTYNSLFKKWSMGKLERVAEIPVKIREQAMSRLSGENL